MKKIVLIAILLMATFFGNAEEQPRRVIVLSDIEADADDVQSLCRLLLYSNQLEIKGLIAGLSTHIRQDYYEREHLCKGIHPETMHQVVAAYGKVHANLLKHDKRYPSAQSIDAVIKRGQEVYGMAGVGDGKDTEGSEWIVNELKRDDDRPLYISVWGGVNTLAQALYKMRHTLKPKELNRLVSKLRVYTISDQDDAGYWIRRTFPNLFYICTPSGNYRTATWIGMLIPFKGSNKEVMSNKWILENIQQGHGALGAIYPDVLYGMEGDSPSFLWLIPNELNNPEHPNWGGWGGRYELYKPQYTDTATIGGIKNLPETRPIWTNAVDEWMPFKEMEVGHNMKWDESNKVKDNYVTIWRWREDFQNDFAARMDWCVKDYNEANHAPIARVNVDDEVNVKSGQYLLLDARNSSDPDGDHLSYLWRSYPEAGSCHINLFPKAWVYHTVTIQVPKVDKPQDAHIILTVKDHGKPQLTSYKRIILHIEP
jgi:hypothetical protein